MSFRQFINLWQDGSTTNDFNEIKDLFFGNGTTLLEALEQFTYRRAYQVEFEQGVGAAILFTSKKRGRADKCLK